MSAVCQVCGRDQVHGILCSSCCDVLERELGDVAAIVGELDVTLSRQARIGGGAPGGLARERMPLKADAMDPIWVLGNVLTTWARDVCGDSAPESDKPPAVLAAWMLLSNIPAIRKHPAVEELFDEITDAIRLARRTVDRPADRKFLGPCDSLSEGVRCTEEVYAAPHATEVKCRVCGAEIEVADRREWLMDKAEDLIVTPQEAATYIGEVGNIPVGHQRIRNYLDRGRIARRYTHDGVMRLRLGDLLEVLRDDSARHTARAS